MKNTIKGKLKHSEEKKITKETNKIVERDTC